MAKRPKRLTEGFIEGITAPGTHGDGRGGHGLKIRAHRTAAGHLTRSWVQQVRIGGRVTHLGLGRWPMVTLREARALALENAAAIYRGHDPRQGEPARVAAPAVAAAPAAPAPDPTPARPVVTFGEAFERMLALHGPAMRPNTVAVHRRSFGQLPARFTGADVARMDSGDVMPVLEPVWLSQPGKGRSILGTIGKTFAYAVGAGLREASPVNHVKAALPPQPQTVHQKAVKVADAPAAIAKLRASGRTPAQRLEALAGVFVALTAVRTTEATGAKWSEIDGAIWTVPASRMKGKRPHRVPLSRAALEVLERVAKLTGSRSGFVFSTPKGTALHRSKPQAAMKRAGVDATAHGWRSTFRQWAADEGVSSDVAEAAIAHSVKGVEGVYQRSDLLKRRAEVMERWGQFATG